jgi:hypothetical protein
VDFVPRVDPDELTEWPFTILAVAQIIGEGMEFAPGITFLGRRERRRQINPSLRRNR